MDVAVASEPVGFGSIKHRACELDYVERVFDHGQVSRTAVVAQLRARIDRLEGAEQDRRTLAVLPALAGLLPGRGVRCGGTYAIEESTALALAMLAGPSGVGAWCAVVGVPTLGVPAAAELGVDLSRLVLVPEPGAQWLGVTAALLDVFDVVLMASGTDASDGETRRLAARVREREAVLLVLGSWPGCEARLTVRDQMWQGLGSGHGHLAARQLTVEVTGRGAAGRPRQARLWLPAPGGGVRLADEAPGGVDDLARRRVGRGGTVVRDQARAG